MTTKTAEATVTGERDVASMFDQALRAMGDSFKAAVKAQEDSVKFWSEAIGKVHPAQAMAGDWMPTAHRNADDYLRLLEASYRRNADLLKKAVAHADGNEGVMLEKRTRDWLEASMEVARDNAQDLASTNTRVAEAWTEVIKKGMQQKAART